MSIRFRHIPVHDFPDSTANWEQIQNLLNAGLAEEYLAAAVRAKLNPSAWTALSLAEALEFDAAGYEPAVRVEQGATSARLRGLLKAKAGKELKAGETACTLTAAFRPSKTVIVGNIQANQYTAITAAGVVAFSFAIKAGEDCALDGITWSIT